MVPAMSSSWHPPRKISGSWRSSSPSRPQCSQHEAKIPSFTSLTAATTSSAAAITAGFSTKSVETGRSRSTAKGGKRSYTRRLGKDRNTRQSCHFIASRNEASPPKAARPSTRQLGFEPMRDANLIAPSRAPSCHRGKLGRNPPGRPVTVTRLRPRKCAGTTKRPDAAASSRMAIRVCAATCGSLQEEVETAGCTI